MSFQNKTVIITGGASGMGKLSAECFAAEGANVVLADINEAALIEVCGAINEKGRGKAIYSVCDVRKYPEVKATADLAVEAFGSIDILLNFAGGFELRMCNCDKPFPETPIEVFDWGIDVNLKGPFYFAHAVCPQMVKQHSGVIINLGSVTGEDGSGSGMAYPTAKAGIMTGLTKSLAQFGFAHNIRAVCVSPGPVLTRPSMANMKTGQGRAAEVQEVVDFIMYLCSDKARAITGSNHFIDCGRCALPHGC
jgi:NAD(P)-dependent dehydrogenase (short-subunit alcohol dehydrogenase family)